MECEVMENKKATFPSELERLRHENNELKRTIEKLQIKLVKAEARAIEAEVEKSTLRKLSEMEKSNQRKEAKLKQEFYMRNDKRLRRLTNMAFKAREYIECHILSVEAGLQSSYLTKLMKLIEDTIVLDGQTPSPDGDNSPSLGGERS